MAAGVEVDTKKLAAYGRRLASGLERAGLSTARTTAEQTAREIANDVPVLTGRLRASVEVVGVDAGYGVSYGQAVPYAAKIERRDHTVARTVDGAADPYYRAQLATAQQEARSA